MVPSQSPAVPAGTEATAALVGCGAQTIEPSTSRGPTSRLAAPGRSDPAVRLQVASEARFHPRELVVAADYEDAGQPDLAWRSRLSAASCFGRAGESASANRLLEDARHRQPDRADEVDLVRAELFPAGPPS